MGERQLAALRASRVSTMLQGATRNLLAYATARQNLTFARLAMPAAQRRRALPDDEVLQRVGLLDQIDQVVSTMSGGQRQRLAIARAVASEPELLLADEPTSQLSHEDRDHVLALIHSLGDDFGTTIVVVTHQPEVAATFARTITMKGGRVGAEGRDGAEYVVVGEEGVLHLPSHVAAEWPPGTLVRIEPEDVDRLLLSRPTDGREHAGRPAPSRSATSPTSCTARCCRTSRSPSAPASSPRCPGRAAPARPRCSRSSAVWSRRPPARSSTPIARRGAAPVTRPRRWRSCSRCTASSPSCPRWRTSRWRCVRGVKPAEADEARRGRAGPLPHRRPGRPPGRGAVGWADAARGVCARGSSYVPRSCSPTSRPRRSTRAIARWCSTELRAEAREGAIVVVATHDPAVVAACDRHYAL